MTDRTRLHIVAIIASYRGQDEISWSKLTNDYIVWIGASYDVHISAETGKVTIQNRPVSDNLTAELDKKLLYWVKKIITFLKTVK